jgi:hypothetical protein
MDVKERLERLTPVTARLPDWEGVLRDARPARVRRAAPRVAIVGAVVGLAALFAVAPWREAERTGILDRARAAVGGGPVLHVVVREGWGAHLVDLETGERTWLNGEREVWYDPSRGLHSVSWLGGARQGEELWPAGKVPRLEAKTYGFLAEGYRQALAAGRARLVGPGVVEGIPVYWIRVDAQVAPEGSRPREWVQDVAVSRESYEPVASRGTRDGGIAPGTFLPIVDLEMLTPGEGDFTKGPSNWDQEAVVREHADQIELPDAASVLGRGPLWLGSEHSGLRLVKVGRRTTIIGGTQETEHKAIQIVYSNGAVSRGPVQLRPKYQGPFVVVHESTDPRAVWFFRAAPGYTPPEGKMLFFGGFALLKHDGIWVAIQASSEKLTLSAARALAPLAAGIEGGG